MKKLTILITIIILVSAGFIFSNETKMSDPIPSSKIMEITGKIEAIMTDIQAGQVMGGGKSIAFIKVKVKNISNGQEHSVQIAPGHFLRLKGISLQKDDMIKIKAYKAYNTPDIKSLEIEIKGKILKIRDRNGKGLWEKPQIRDKRFEYQKR